MRFNQILLMGPSTSSTAFRVTLPRSPWCREGRLIVGVVYDPVSGDLCEAVLGEEFGNGQLIAGGRSRAGHHASGLVRGPKPPVLSLF